jgi:hypothetical protein
VKVEYDGGRRGVLEEEIGSSTLDSFSFSSQVLIGRKLELVKGLHEDLIPTNTTEPT